MLRLGLGALAGYPAFAYARDPALPIPPVPPRVLYPAPPVPPRPGGEALPPPFVMIDPGHGGSDPGTIGPHGVEEKTISLATGLALHAALARTGRYRIGMTRTRDVFVTLAERVALAMAAHAELFVSLHCNHMSDASVRGAMVFTLSHVASDRMAAEVASTENSFDRGPVDPALRGLAPDVATILGGLEMRATDLGSKTVASDIVAMFQGYVPLINDNPERSANFAVLRDPTVPSTLIEMGFLSNPEDERLLTSPAHRALIAERVTAAIARYFDHAQGRRFAG